MWDHKQVRAWSDVAHGAQRAGKKVHMGRLFGLCVETGSELPPEDPRRKFKCRVVFGGHNVIDQSWESAVSQNLGSSPSTMATGKFVDYYSCLEGNEGQQADAEQAYVQAELKGTETWVYIPPEGWPEGMLSSICKDAGKEFRTPQACTLRPPRQRRVLGRALQHMSRPSRLSTNQGLALVFLP